MSRFQNLIFQKPNPASNEKKVRIMNIVLAIVLAIILWAYVIGEVNPETETTVSGVPLRIVGTNVLESKGLTLLTEFDDTVTVVVSGRRSDVYNVNASKLSAKIDVSDCVEGENQVSVQISAPDKVSKAEARDGDFLVIVDKVVTEEKPVDIQISGDLSSDTSVEIVNISEDKISVTGPSTYVEQVDSVRGVLKVKDSAAEYNRSVKLTPVDKDGNPVERVELSQETVTVEAEKLLTRTVSVEVVTTGSAPAGMSVTPASNLKLKIRGHYDDIKSIASLKTAPVNISGITQNTTMEVTVQLPPNITALDSGGDPIRNQTDDSVVIKVDFVVKSASDEGEAPASDSGDNASSDTAADTDSGADNSGSESNGETETDNSEEGESQQP